MGYQWYLSNQGQDVLSGIRPVAGIDLNVTALHARGVTGRGVQVAVVDNGLEIHHEDLAANVLPGGSIDFTQCSDPSNLASCGFDSSPVEGERHWTSAHGTSVGGVIGMVGWNDKGGRGVAPGVSLQGFNLLAPGTVDYPELTWFALGDQNERARATDVFNLSYGEERRYLPTEDAASRTMALEELLAATRGGKGGIYVKAAGNEYFRSGAYPLDVCTLARQHDVGCFDSATDPENSAFGMLVTAALTAAGERANYSSEGANVWLAGFGGEFNKDPAFVPEADDIEQQPAILTTDWSVSCDVGFHNDRYFQGLTPNIPPLNALDNGSRSVIDPDCRYTTRFNATSAATPTVSAVAALILQTRPDFTARDVRHALVMSARNDTWREGFMPQPARRTEGGRVFDPGWHVNQAGGRFSRWYGYGQVDAGAAVALAERMAVLPADEVHLIEPDDFEPVPILDGSQFPQDAGLALEFPHDLVVEGVQIAFATTHLRPANLLISLVSPSGTRIPVITPYTSLAPLPDADEGGFNGYLVGVNGFYGEAARGDWTLIVEDVAGEGYTDEPALLIDFALRLQGHTAKQS